MGVRFFVWFNADADAQVFVGAQKFCDAFDAVVTGAGTTERHADMTFINVQIVVNHDDVFGCDFVFAHDGKDGLPRQVHIRKRFKN